MKIERWARLDAGLASAKLDAMQPAPLISVLLPVRNGAATIGRAIDGVGAQTLSDWEVIAVDDGSTDDTARLLAEAARRDERIRVLTQPAAGIVTALNTGWRAARGRFLARLDADDEVHPERFALQAEFLRAHPETGVVSSLVAYGGDRAANAGYAHHVDWLNTVVTPDELALNRFIESPVAHPSVMFRRELAERHGVYAEGGFPEDYELWLRWADAGVRMAKVPRELLVWHDSPTRASRTDPRYSPEAFYRVKAKYLARELGRILGRDRGGERAVWIWGAGRPTRKRAAALTEHGVTIAGYIDIDGKKTGKRVGGVPVIGPAELPAAGSIFVLGYVASRGARELIRTELKRRGWVEGRQFLMCA